MIRYTCNYPSDDIHFQLKLNLERSQDTVLEQLTAVEQMTEEHLIHKIPNTGLDWSRYKETLHTKLRVLSHSVDW